MVPEHELKYSCDHQLKLFSDPESPQTGIRDFFIMLNDAFNQITVARTYLLHHTTAMMANMIPL